MDCQECNHLLPLLVDETLTQTEHRLVQNHLAECCHCREEFDILAKTVKLVQCLPQIEAPADFQRRLLARLEQEAPTRIPWAFWRTLSLSTVAAAAMVLLTLIVYNPIQNLAPMAFSKAPAAPAPVVQSVKSDAKAAALKAEVRSGQGTDQAVKTASRPVESAPRRADAEKIADESLELSAAEQDELKAAQSTLYRPVASGPVGAVPVYPVALEQPVAAPKSRVASALYREKAEWSGEFCQVASPATKILRSPQALAALWSEARITALPVPAVDWNRQMLGMIFLGNRQGRGYEVQLRAVQGLPDKIMVRFHVAAPENKSNSTSQPFLAFLLPATPLPVLFQEE